MAITGAAELLAAWEAGLAEAPARRALLLHRTARPDVEAERLPVLPVGEREADLFTLRRALFGERMQVRLECAACGEDMEFDLDAGELAGSAAGRGESVVRVRRDGWDVEFRLPGAADLTAAARAADPRTALLARCLVTAERDGTAVPAQELPEPVRRRIAEEVEAADPGADLTLNVACPECGQATRAELDIASYLWTELDAWARDVLLDVHLLATAYGWSEPEILALSPLRRRYYLELCADV
ncbi:T4 family baseplate hub assembly chaperone [Streptomyces lincolnensis]|uniref:T4 family baseplate hub assembly chaperone n=1 Tax=Streptomyces lincolnensis TaxID=1915 RepID=UPI0037D9390E